MPSYNLSSLNVLIADDHLFMGRLLSLSLKAFGVGEIHVAQDGKEAIEILSSTECHLLLSDWNMPQVDGLDLICRVRAGKHGLDQYLPIIMVTGYQEPERVSVAVNSGIDDYLVKPISARRLYTRVVNLIERPRTFIRSDGYFGPDRRKVTRTDSGPERRAPTDATKNHDEDVLYLDM